MSDPNPPIPEEVQRLLEIVYDRFHANGAWPEIDDLRWELDQADDDLDLPAVALLLDPVFGHASDRGGTAVGSLTIHGVAACEGSQEELDDVLRAARQAYQKYRVDGRKAQLTDGDLLDLGMTSLAVRRTYELMQGLPGIGGGGGSPADGTWSRQLTADIIYLKKVETVTELLEKAPRTRRFLPAMAVPQDWGATLVSKGQGERLRNLGEHVSREVERMSDNIESDPPDAITAARSLLETVCRSLMAEMELPEASDGAELSTLYGTLARSLQLEPTESDVIYRKMLQGLVSTVQGMAEVRNKLGDAHGSGPGRPVALPRHARAAATAAIAVSVFLFETVNERRNTLP